MTNKRCSFNGCDRPHLAKGLCKSHYNQMNRGDELKPLSQGRNGNPGPRGPYRHRSGTMEEAFWSRVKKSDGCWEWTGGRSTLGYGRFKFRGLSVLAHRHSMLLAGHDPEGFYVDHLCHNASCVNPMHLRLATPGQNMENRKGAHSNSRSGIRGVYGYRGRWRGSVSSKGVEYRKEFRTVEEAAEWVKATRLKHHGM